MPCLPSGGPAVPARRRDWVRRAACRVVLPPAEAMIHAAQVASDVLSVPLLRCAAERLAPAVRTPPHFLYTLFCIEDKRFVVHGGLDPLAVVRAAAVNIVGRGALQGASTLTQQLYNVRREAAGQSRERTVPVKWRQGLWAVRHDAARTKREILASYLDRVYWGRSYYGIDAAARGYCDTTRGRLTVAQSFFLVERLATPNAVRGRRIAVLLRRRSLRRLFADRPAAQAELVALYERNFGAGSKTEQWRDALPARRRAAAAPGPAGGRGGVRSSSGKPCPRRPDAPLVAAAPMRYTGGASHSDGMVDMARSPQVPTVEMEWICPRCRHSERRRVRSGSRMRLYCQRCATRGSAQLLQPVVRDQEAPAQAAGDADAGDAGRAARPESEG